MSEELDLDDFEIVTNFKKGSYVARKGKLCVIEAIDWNVYPPLVIVKTADTNAEIGTEFDQLEQIHSWRCNICTSPNLEIEAEVCCFCRLRRDWTEELILTEEQLDTKDTIRDKERRWRLFCDGNQSEIKRRSRRNSHENQEELSLCPFM